MKQEFIKGAQAKKKWLKDNGYDGLFNPEGPCSCSIEDDFVACGDEDIGVCMPTYQVCEAGTGADYCMVTNKPERAGTRVKKVKKLSAMQIAEIILDLRAEIAGLEAKIRVFEENIKPERT